MNGKGMTMVGDWELAEEQEFERDSRALSRAGIAEENRFLLRCYRDFRRAADAVAAAWRGHPEVAAVALIGSLSVAPWKEVPRFSPYRRARVELWHECKDLDLALWLDDLSNLNGLRRAKNKALAALHGPCEGGVASHQTDVFVLEPGSDRYLGRLCDFNRCPKGKRDCRAPGCGATAFLKQHEDFRWRPETLAPERCFMLFDRASGRIAAAAQLPLPEEAGEVQQPMPPDTNCP